MNSVRTTGLSDEAANEFKQHLLEINIKREKHISCVLVLFNLVLFLLDTILVRFNPAHTHVFNEFTLYHAGLILISLLYIAWLRFGPTAAGENFMLRRGLHLAFNTSILLVCSLVAVQDKTDSNRLYPYVTAVFCIAALTPHSKFEAHLIFLPSYFLSMTGILTTSADPKEMVGNGIFVTLIVTLAIITSTINHAAYKKSFHDSKIILDKNKELGDISALLQATFDNIPDIITVKNPQNELLHCNKVTYDYFRTDSQNTIGRKCYELIGRSMPCEDCATREVLKNKQPVRVERYVDSMGIWLDVRAYPILDEADNVLKIIEHNRDITLQKEVEAELLMSNSVLKAQQEASLDGILVMGIDRRIMGYNRRFMELWSVPDRIMEGKDGNELLKSVLPDVIDADEFRSRVEELYAAPLESSCEKVYLKNGTVLDRYSAPILLAQGEVVGRVWYFRDITEKEKIDVALRASAEENERLLKEAMQYDELKSEFFSNISHEFRTPINVLLSTLQLMGLQQSGTKENEQAEKTARYLKVMKQNCYRLLRLTNNLIDMTRLDTGFFEINLCNCDIVRVVEDITLSVADYIEHKGIQLVFDTDMEEKLLAVDADKIERIMLNLLSNAVKFTREQGTIRVDIRDRGESVEIAVKDTGVGIPQEKLDIIFERFRQVNSSLSRNNEGSGIGLSLVKNLVELHGGTIRVHSEAGSGSEFIVELPCRLLDESMDPKSADIHPQSHVERVSIEFSDIYSAK